MNEGETYHRDLITFVGGVSNIALLVSELGENVKFVGKVGKDPFGEFIKEKFRKSKIDTFFYEPVKNPTGLCVSLVSKNGERTMVAMRGANDYLSKEEISINIDQIVNSKVLFFSGYSLLSEKNMETIIHILEKAIENNCKIYFNPGAPNIISPNFKNIIKKYVDVLISNYDEARNLSNENKTSKIIEKISKIVKNGVITLGNSGCIAFDEKYVYQIPTDSLKIKDSTGAGDSFISGFIVGDIRGLNLKDRAKFGNNVSTKFLKEKNKNIKNF